MNEHNEFDDVTAALERYRPAAPSADGASKIAAALTAPTTAPSSQRWWLLGAAAAIVLALGAVWMMDAIRPVEPKVAIPVVVDSMPALSASTSDFRKVWLQQARLDMPYPPQPNGVTVVIFMDWLCPVCFIFDGDLRSVLDPLVRAYPGRIFVYYEDWPWDAECNDTLTREMSGHEGACELASAVRQARSRGRDAILIDWLGKHQKDWRDLGLPKEFRFPDPSIKAEIDATVKQSIAKGKALKITSTPTLFINGVRVDSQRLPREHLDMAIRIELERAGVIAK